MGIKILFILSLCTVSLGDDTSDAHDHPVVHTSLGSIQGEFVHRFGEDVVINIYRFLGIPYAQPPVGELRFRKTVPVQPWTGTYQATKYSDICVQSMKAWEVAKIPSGGKPNEDCLYLNIWTPQLPKEGSNPKKPVMVFIHGGAFKAGSASQPFYDGNYFASYGDVVLVTINYRVSILGFLNLGTEDVPGNQGLWDQRLALMWVREHIHHFGGDPDQVTVFGESAGSLSTGAHLLSPTSQGLFQRAIMQSGSPINPTLLRTPEEAVEAALKFAKQQGCSKQSEGEKQHVTSDLINCLKHIDIGKILEAEDEHFYDIKMPHAVPTYGDEFLPKNHSQQMSEMEQKPIDLMIGIVANEGSLFAIHKIMEVTGEYDTNPFTLEDAKTVTRNIFSSTNPSLVNEAVFSYFGHKSEDTPVDTLKQIVSFAFGDYLLACPTVYFAEYFSMYNPVYFYHFNHSSGVMPEWMGVNHGEDITFLFRASFFPNVTYSKDELEFSRDLVQLWATFARTGKPKLPGVETWPMYSEDRPMFVDLRLKEYTVDAGVRMRGCNFWRCHLQRP